jgi:hypothetical protein
MRLRAAAAVLAVAPVLLGAGVSTGGASPAVPAPSLRLPAGRALYPGESLPVTVINNSASSFYRSNCLLLARWDGGRWQEVVRSHGVNVGCAIWAGATEGPHSRQSAGLALYDDLLPGTYRITLYYRPVPTHWRVLKALTRRDRFARLQFVVGRAPVRQRPQLPEKRVLALAMAAAKRGGDPLPSLVQHAAGTRFNAVRIGQGDLVFEWNWSYLIAVRGHFSYSGQGPPGSSSTVHGTVITLVVDTATGRVTDSGVSDRYPPLARLGKVTTDLRRSSGGASSTRRKSVRPR